MKFLLDIVSTPAILVALIAVIGLVLQKKSLPDIMKGGIKTFVGFLVVSGGAGIIQNSLNPFGKCLNMRLIYQGLFQITSQRCCGLNDIWFFYSDDYVFRNGLNILIARFTRFKIHFLNRSPYALYGVYDCCYLIGCWIYESSINFTWRISIRNHHECFTSLCSKIYGAVNRK